MAMKRCRLALAALALGLLTACAGGRGGGPAVAHYDLGSPRPVAGAGFPLRAVEVQAAAWLGTPAMQYRLAYADAGRREAYAQSRWASPPAQLLESALQRELLGSEPGGGCRLRIELDEFIQVFDGAQSSRALAEVRMVLKSLRNDAPLARHSLRIERAAETADARGGARAFGQVAQELGGAAAAWLRRVGSEDAALLQRCRAG